MGPNMHFPKAKQEGTVVNVELFLPPSVVQ
jgi:hypothetical protein